MIEGSAYNVCSHCGAQVPMTAGAGDRCPNCGAVFTHEQQSPASALSGPLPEAPYNAAPSASACIVMLIALVVYLPLLALVLRSVLRSEDGSRWWWWMILFMPMAIIAIKSGRETMRKFAWPYLLLIVSAGFNLIATIMFLALYPATQSDGWLGSHPLFLRGGDILFAAGYFAWALKSYARPDRRKFQAAAGAAGIIILGVSLQTFWAAIYAWAAPEIPVYLRYKYQALDGPGALLSAIIMVAAGLRATHFRTWPDFLQLGGATAHLVFFLAGMVVVFQISNVSGEEWHTLNLVLIFLRSAAFFVLVMGFFLAAHPGDAPSPPPA